MTQIGDEDNEAFHIITENMAQIPDNGTFTFICLCSLRTVTRRIRKDFQDFSYYDVFLQSFAVMLILVLVVVLRDSSLVLVPWSL